MKTVYKLNSVIKNGDMNLQHLTSKQNVFGDKLLTPNRNRRDV